MAKAPTKADLQQALNVSAFNINQELKKVIPLLTINLDEAQTASERTCGNESSTPEPDPPAADPVASLFGSSAPAAEPEPTGMTASDLLEALKAVAQKGDPDGILPKAATHMKSEFGVEALPNLTDEQAAKVAVHIGLVS